MATIFLSYRRSDSPQACRVYDWLAGRFGKDQVFMDVAAIPFAVDYAACIQEAIIDAKVMIALIGNGWLKTIREPDDPVCMEIETACQNQVPVLPVLIGNTPMPDPDELPASITTLAFQNAVTVGVSHDFHTHMQALLPRIETILGTLSAQSVVTDDPEVIHKTCDGIIYWLQEMYPGGNATGWHVSWETVNTIDHNNCNRNAVTMLMHRAARLGESLELHFLLSLWGIAAAAEHKLAGWVIHHLERHPMVPDEFFNYCPAGPPCNLKIRRSDEDPRRIWNMITDEPLCLSLAYVATVSPEPRNTIP